MGYLDDLSRPPQEQGQGQQLNDEDSSDPSIGPGSWKGPFQNTAKGLVPSGRGPLGSYLDFVSSSSNDKDTSSSSNKEEECEQNDERNKQEDTIIMDKRPAAASSWSNSYLTKFLDSSKDDARTDIRNLLTQRAIQSFMRLLEECRDPHSAKWIQQDFLEQRGNLVDYHGTGVQFIQKFGGTWDVPLLSMMQQPPHQIIISAKRRGRGHGGWSPNNPYLQERWVEIPVQIDPPNLVTRILSVREQIAKEWSEKDLDALIVANDLILDSFFEQTKAKRNRDIGSYEAGGGAFVRMAQDLINDNARFSTQASSPFRRSNFDLLYNLCTQAAIHRLLREKMKRRDGDEDVSFQFLRDFYTGRAEEYFDGDLPFGRADDFLEDLLETSPFVMSSSNRNDVGTASGLVDPVGAAEEIIQMRRLVAQEWKILMQRVPDDHMVLRQALLSNQMKRMQKDSSSSNDPLLNDSSESLDGFQ